jgi:hypothetical protein
MFLLPPLLLPPVLRPFQLALGFAIGWMLHSRAEVLSASGRQTANR